MFDIITDVINHPKQRTIMCRAMAKALSNMSDGTYNVPDELFVMTATLLSMIDRELPPADIIGDKGDLARLSCLFPFAAKAKGLPQQVASRIWYDYTTYVDITDHSYSVQ